MSKKQQTVTGDEPVTFAWNSAIVKRIITFNPSTTRYTESGAMQGKPSDSITITRGEYTTSDHRIIELLKNHDDYESPSKDGFHIAKKITEQDELEAIAKRHGKTVAELVGDARE